MMRESLRGLWTNLEENRRRQFKILLVVMVLSGFIEMISVTAVIPLLTMIISGDSQLCEFGQGWCDLSLLKIGILFCGLILIGGSLRIFLVWYGARFSFGLGLDIGTKIYAKVLSQPYDFYISTNTAEITASINRVNSVVANVVNPLINAMVAAFISITIILTLIYLEPFVALSSMVLFAAIYLVTTLFSKSILNDNAAIVKESENEKIKMINEGMGGIRDIIIDNITSIYLQRFFDADRRQRKAQAQNTFVSVFPRFLIETLGLIIIVILSMHLVYQGRDIAEILPVLGAMALGAQKVLPQMQLIYYAWSSSNGAKAALKDVLSRLELGESRGNALNASELIQKGEDFIEFKDVDFGYEAGVPLTLKCVNFSIPLGAKVGIVGQTGSGKSTLVDLIMSLLTPTRGTVMAFGSELDASNILSFQKCIAHVPQSIFLADATIRENIIFGKSQEVEDSIRLKQAIEIAQLSQLIKELNAGLDTAVGERGVKLSGGQRQRIGIARALYKQADVLILDEATSALDHDTESAFINALSEQKHEITLIMIAHRKTTLSNCDFILSLPGDGSIELLEYEDI